MKKSGGAEVRCCIVQAVDQSKEDTPSKRTLELGKLISFTDIETDSCVHAALNTVTKDLHYGVSVAYMVERKTVTKQCTKTVALVIATNPTGPDILNGGHQMITQDVQDPFHKDSTCQLFFVCTVTVSPDY